MREVEQNVSFPKQEEEVLTFWREQKIFHQTLEKELPKRRKNDPTVTRKPYIFYDGPPFATGLPHYGHLLAGTIKDVVGRFFTMKGYHVDRRFGWDCHGLPVEFEIQKALNLSGAKDIKAFGIGNFNEECRKIVLRYTQEWERFVERSGRWVDMSRQYRTMDLDFMETIWWVIRRLWDRGLIYEGFKCVPYSWAVNTPLSNFELNQNYKNVQDPAITVRADVRVKLTDKFGVKDAPALPVRAYVWTTTPWTLPSNMAFAVGPELSYSFVELPDRGEVVLLGAAAVERLLPEVGKEGSTARVLKSVKGSELLGLEYTPFFSYFEEHRANNAFRIYPGEFVTEVDGTGIVHCASFGEDDLKLFLANKVPVVDPVDENGNFTDQVPDFAGLNVKAADSKIIAHLKEKGLLVDHKTIEHSYPFCWRSDTPLIYKSISSWFVRVEEFRDELVQMNSLVHWVPEHIRDGRFGKWLEVARDWAISRNRYWGTPIPVWRCAECKDVQCLGSVQELQEKSGAKITDLHRHFIDDLVIPCAKCGKEMRRIPEVLDCWFESGSMPYAQAHYPFEGKEQFEKNFPADFIAEGIDQTRGWFYTLIVLSTALFGRPAFRNVIVNGIVLAEDGKKMSKSLKNYPPPDEVMNEYGADAMRLYLLSSAAARADEIRFSKNGVRDVVRQTLLPLWNAYNFFVTYALVDKWNPGDIPEEPSPNLLDQWILSRTGSLIKGVDTALSNYHLYSAAQPILEFVDQLTNWYIRLNRRRFWSGEEAGEVADKMHAYATLHRVLVAFVRVLAPLAPFISESIYKNLNEDGYESVHLAPFPSLEEFSDITIRTELEHAMELFEDVIVLGRNIRNETNIKVRQPLSKITVVHPEASTLEDLKLLDQYIREELNVKTVEYTTDEEKFVTFKAQLNTKILGKTLGPKLGSEGMKALRDAVENLSGRDVRTLEEGDVLTVGEVELRKPDVIIKRSVKPGAEASASSGAITVVLDTALTQELRLEGLSREFVNRVQKLRKEFDFDVSDRIVVRFMTACSRLQLAVQENKEYIAREVLAVDVIETSQEKDLQAGGLLASAQEVDGKPVVIAVGRIQG